MQMMSCHLDRKTDVPLYEQLYNYIKTEILEGRIPYGTKLPSKRKLADFLNISQNTVEQAYDQLVAEGYIEGIPRKGYFVLASEDLEYIDHTPGQAVVENTKQEIRYNFHPGQIDTENFPFAKWRKYSRNMIDKKYQELLLVGHQQGELILRNEIANYLYQARGINCSPDAIVVGAGVEILLQQLIHLLGEKMVYGVEDPGYHAISYLLEHYPNEVHPLKVDNKGMIVDELDESNINVVHVTPSHHFPYGFVLSANRRIKLLNWAAQKEDRYIIEDDYNSEFRYTGKSIPPLLSMDQNEKVIYLGTFSKSLMPSIRISYMVLPKKLMVKYRKKLSYLQCSVSRIDQHVLAEFMKEGDFARHLNRMRNVYRRKMEQTLQLLEPYKGIIKVAGKLTGFHLVLEVKNGMHEDELVKRALNAEVKIFPLSYYVMENHSKSIPVIILGFAGIPEDKLPDAINQLINSWEIA